MQVPPYTPSRPRRLAKPKTGVLMSPPPVSALVLLGASITSFGGSDAVVELVFDASADDPLVDVESSRFLNWTATIEEYAFEGNGPLEWVSYDTLLLFLGNVGASEGPDRISYAAQSPGIVTDSGRVLGAFADRALI